MLFFAQVDKTGKLYQGVAFRDQSSADAHIGVHNEYTLIATDEFVSPFTHEVVNGVVQRKTV